jgi:PST family polysaccharide transporter
MNWIKEQIQKINLRGWLVNTFISLVGINVFVAFLSFVTTIIIANSLGKEDFGNLAFSIAIGTYGLMFVQYGFEKSFVRELVHFPNRLGEFFKASLLLKSLLFVVFLLLLIIVANSYPKRFQCSWGMILVIIATALGSFQIPGGYDAWREMKRHSLFSMLERCVYFLLVWFIILTPFLVLSLNLVGIFLLISAGVGVFTQYRWAMPRINFKSVNGLWPSTVFLVRSNIFIWLAVLSGLSIDYMSQIILKLNAGSSELGIYSVAWKITQIGTLFLTQAGRIGSEATARYTRPETSVSERNQFLIKYISLMTVLGALVGLPCMLFPQYILRMFNSEYANAFGVLRFFAFYPILYGPFLATLQYVISMRMQITYFALITIAGISCILLNLWLIPIMQSKGAVISVILSLAVALTLFLAAIYYNTTPPIQTRSEK